MRTLSLTLLVALAFGCGDSDITDDLQIDLDAISNIDAPPGQPDADTTQPDADTTQPDADTTQPDADTSQPDADTTDADTTQPDASGDPGQIFCDRYDTLCGYDALDNNRYDDEATCLSDYDGFTTPQQTCVENQLDLLESDGNLNHCRSAMGRPPCN